MKLNFFSMENEIDFSRNNVWRFLIENKGMFINVINNINNLCNGIEVDDKISIYQGESVVRWDKEVILIINPWYMQEYEKRIQSDINKYIEREIIQEEKLSDFQIKVNEINNIFYDVLSEINLDITYKNIMIADYVKAMGLKVNIGEGSAYNNIINLINSMSYIKGYKLIILVNSNIYFKEDELIEIIKQIRYNETNILMIDKDCFEGKLADESVLYIDEDFCERTY